MDLQESELINLHIENNGHCRTSGALAGKKATS